MLRDRTTRRDLLWIALVALAWQAFWALRIQHPTYFDAYYYTTNAQRLAGGYGFTQEIIWQYLSDPAGLPNPSFTYWMPLPALIAAAGYRLFDSFRAAQFPFWLMAGLLPWLSYAISWRLGENRRRARTAALLTAAGGYYAAYWNQPTTFALFAWVGGGCLLALAWTGEREGAKWWLSAGLLAGLAHLARADGVLLLGIGGLIWLVRLVETWRADAPLRWGTRVGQGAAFVVGYLLVMGGWFWRTYRLIGSPMSAVGTQTIFLTTYDDVFAYGRSFDLSGYLAWGWGNIIRSKLAAASLALQTFVAVTGLTVFTFFLVWAWLALARRRKVGAFLRPFTWYALLLYGMMAFIFTFPGQRGSLLHSSAALWPWAMALAPAGIDMAVDWVAARRPHWRPAQAKRLFALVFVPVVFAVSFAVAIGQPLLEDEAAVFRQIQADLPPGAVVMIGSPPGFYYHTGLPAVVTPNEPPPVVLQIAERYGVTHLVLTPDTPQPLEPLYEGEESYERIRPLRRYDLDFELYQLVRE